MCKDVFTLSVTGLCYRKGEGWDGEREETQHYCLHMYSTG